MKLDDQIGLTFDALRALFIVHPNLDLMSIEAAIDEAERQVKADIAESAEAR